MTITSKIKTGITIVLLVLIVATLFSDRALPSSVELFTLKRLQEKFFMAIKTNPKDKIDYYNILLDKRIEELKTIIKNREPNLILSSSLRYSTTAGLMTELIISNHLTEVVNTTQEKFKKHQEIFKNLDNSYQKDEGEEWKFIQDDYNYLSIYSQQLTNAFGNKTKDK